MSPRASDPRRRWTLARVLAPYVTERTRAKGYSYFVTGTVTIINTTTELLTANVRGTRLYHVTVAREDAGFTAVCECPYFADRVDICKHIWATVLAADAEGLLPPEGPDAWLDVGAVPAADEVALGRTHYEPPAPWEQFLDGVLHQVTSADWTTPASRYHKGELLYVIDRDLTLQGHGVAVTALWRQRKKNGEWGKPQPAGFSPAEIEHLPDTADREILSALMGAADPYAGNYATMYSRAAFRIVGPITDRVLWLLASSRRLYLRDADTGTAEMRPVSADEGPPWQLRLRLEAAPDGRQRLDGLLTRGDDTMDVREPQLVLDSGHLIARGLLSRLDHAGAFAWLAELRRVGEPPSFPDAVIPRFVETLAQSRVDPAILPEPLRFDVVEGRPRPHVSVERARTAPRPGGEHELTARVAFEYDATIVPNDGRPTAYDPDRRRMISRDRGAEQLAIQRLQELGFRRAYAPQTAGSEFTVTIVQFGRAVRTLVAEGWRVEAEGSAFRTANAMRVQVRSGIDWFELHGELDFGDGGTAPLTSLLAALRRGEGTILLDDGTRGMVPEEWLRRYVRIAGFGEVQDDHVRYRPSQTALLDALLEAQPDVDVDERFARAREAMTAFRGVSQASVPASFTGTLREYQLEALGWFDFLRTFGFGGCLADDMGLGKTVMVLALLDARRTQQEGERRPSVAVVPRSLVFNWIAEARRFAPQLRVLDYTGPEPRQRLDHRSRSGPDDVRNAAARRRAALWRRVRLRHPRRGAGDQERERPRRPRPCGCCAAGTGSPSAARRSRTTSASCGASSTSSIRGCSARPRAFRRASLVQSRDGGEDLALVARALKPLILRRTKEQVAPELPIADGADDLLRARGAAAAGATTSCATFYRASLLKRVEEDGLEPVEDARARSAAAAAAGRLPPRPRREAPAGRAVARSSTCCSRTCSK